MVVGDRIDVDDRAAHGELAAALDLVLTAVSRGDEGIDQLVAVDRGSRPHDDGLHLLDMGTEALHECAHGRDEDLRRNTGAQPPHDPEAPPHRLERR